MADVVARGTRYEIRCRHVDCSPSGDRSVLVLSCGRYSDALQAARGHTRAHELDMVASR